jgi:hypothetical protein
MKQARDPSVLYAFSRLRAGEFATLVAYLREQRLALLEDLASAPLEGMAKLQGEVATLTQILKYVDEGELLAAKYQAK